jgi:hypothetical protein
MHIYWMGRTTCRMQQRPEPTRNSHLAERFRRPISVNPLRFFVDAFVNTFGITQPKPEAEARAGRFIALMLVAVLIVLAAAVWALRSAFTR